MERRRGLGAFAAAMVACAGLVLPVPPVSAAGEPSCAVRKASVEDLVGWAVVRLAWRFTSSLKTPQRVSSGLAGIALRRIERQHERAHAVCAGDRLRRLDRFVETARVVAGGPMEQAAVEELLTAYDRFDTSDLSSIDWLHRCQERLADVHLTYEVDYSGPRRWGRNGWVMLGVQNSTGRDLYVSLSGWMLAVRPVPGQGGRYVPELGGRRYDWGGSSSDLMLAEAGQTTEHYAAPARAWLRLRADGYIAEVHADMYVDFGRVTCAGPVWPLPQSRSTTQSMQAVRASTSAGSTAGYIAMRSWLRPSLR